MNARTIKQTLALAALGLAPASHAETKVWLCTGDFGMWAQDRAALIQKTVNEAAPGAFSFEVDQSFNLVKKLEAPNFAERFDVIVLGDISMGQMTTRAQEALVRFVNNGGGLVYSMNSKSGIPYAGPMSVEPQPLKAILPFEMSDVNGWYSTPKPPVAGAVAIMHTDAFFAGLDFSNTPLLNEHKSHKDGEDVPHLMLERLIGEKQGRSIVIYGGMQGTYKYVGYADHREQPNGWNHWDGFGQYWTRILNRAATASPILKETRAAVDAKAKDVPCVMAVEVDATKTIDDIRAGVFSVLSLSQLYDEDGGNGEAEFLALNPQGWIDRHTEKVLKNTAGTIPDKVAFCREKNITGIVMANSSYGAWFQWDEEKKVSEIKRAVDYGKEYPDILTYLQADNEPLCEPNYFGWYNRFMGDVLKEVPAYKAIGPGTSWNLKAPNENDFKAFIEQCGKNTDVLNWHIYARVPSSVREQVLYWTKYAEGKLRSAGPVKVMFTEADAWNTRDSQFNYLVDRAFTFLPMPEIIQCMQYCMRPRYEGGTYWFGVLMDPPQNRPDYLREFTANYNGYWIFRNLRGKMAEAKADVTPAAAAENCRVIASVSPDGATVTVVAYYDTGFYNGAEKSAKATAKISVKLPAGNYALETSKSNWDLREVDNVEGTVSGTANVVAELKPCHAIAWTWTRK